MTTIKTTLQPINASVHPEVQMSENLDALSAAAIFAKRAAATTGLTWAYFGGIYNGNNIDDGTVALTNTATNYVVVLRSSGVVSVSTATTNWNSTLYARLYKLTVAGSVVTVEEDHRQDSNGLLFAENVSPLGRHAVYVAAAAMQPSVTGGCAALASVASAANQPDIVSLDFDATTQEYAQFGIVMPKSWNEGVITFKAHWSHPATVTSFGVAVDLQAVAVSDDDAIAVAFGTAVAVTDTGGTTNDLYTTAESGNITVAGTPAAEDMVFFRLSRVTGNGSDTMTVDMRLHGITLYITTDAATDS